MALPLEIAGLLRASVTITWDDEHVSVFPTRDAASKQGERYGRRQRMTAGTRNRGVALPASAPAIRKVLAPALTRVWVMLIAPSLAYFAGFCLLTYPLIWSFRSALSR